MADLRIYDYSDDLVVVPLQKEISEIDGIRVCVLSGDEVVDVYFSDGEIQHADSSGCRLMDFMDGEYTISGEENIIRFLKWQPGREEHWSYERMKEFGGW